MATIERLSHCRGCGSRLAEGLDVSQEPYAVQDAMAAYCRTCAYEVLDIAIPFVGSLQHDCGGGHRVIRSTKAFS